MLAAAILIFSSQSSAAFAQAMPGPAHAAIGVTATVIRPASFSTMVSADDGQSISLTNVEGAEVDVSGGSVATDGQDRLIITPARSGATIVTLKF
jgi:hypothetical protein